MYSKLVTNLSFTSIVATSLVVIACGGSVESTPVTGDSGVTSGGSTLAQMTEAELETFCGESAARYDSQISDAEEQRIGCALIGAFSAFDAKTDLEAQQKCQSAYDACLAEPFKPGTVKNDCGDFVKNAKTCELTPAEVTACTDEQVEIIKRLAAPNACSTVKAGEPTADPPPPSPKCDAAKAKCPSLFSDSSEEK